jgi:glycosyltransferase involved in cell wall biosynthesis
MKVTFFTTDWDNCVAGPNSWIKRILPNLREKGVDIRVLACAFGQQNNPTIEFLLKSGFDCKVFQAQKFFTIPVAIRWILQQLKKDTPDIFVPSTGTMSFYAAKWVKSEGIPTVNVLHSDDAYHRGVLKQFIFGEPDFRFSALVCVSKFLEEFVLSQKPKDTLIKYIPYGTPLPSGKASLPSIDRFRLVYVGRLVEEQKRASEVARALCLATLTYPNCEAVMYGDGDAKPAVQAVLEQYKGHKVTLFGRVDSQKIQNKLLESHALVLLSDYEGLPISVLEAMACGVVPICLNIRSGVSELIKDGENGFLVCDRKDDFLKAVGKLQSNAKLWENLSQNAVKTIQESYSESFCAREWISLFEYLNSRKSKPVQIKVPLQIKLPTLNDDIEHSVHRVSVLGFYILKFFNAIKWRVEAILLRNASKLTQRQ